MLFIFFLPQHLTPLPNLNYLSIIFVYSLRIKKNWVSVLLNQTISIFFHFHSYNHQLSKWINYEKARD